eukprot:6202733-Lingulodinium_polyedra.AAC.1
MAFVRASLWRFVEAAVIVPIAAGAITQYGETVLQYLCPVTTAVDSVFPDCGNLPERVVEAWRRTISSISLQHQKQQQPHAAAKQNVQ